VNPLFTRSNKAVGSSRIISPTCSDSFQKRQARLLETCPRKNGLVLRLCKKSRVRRVQHEKGQRLPLTSRHPPRRNGSIITRSRRAFFSTPLVAHPRDPISSSMGSSPLTPLQFMRRVDEGVPGMGLGGPPFGPLLGTIPLPPRAGSPSKPGPHHKPTPRKVSAKQPVWRF
jgi:hypothetical protein